MPAAEEIYDQKYFETMRGGDEIYRHFLSLVDDLPKGLTVLDAGCGRGELMAALTRWGAAKVEGFDIAEPAVEITMGSSPNGRLGASVASIRVVYESSSHDHPHS